MKPKFLEENPSVSKCTIPIILFGFERDNYDELLTLSISNLSQYIVTILALNDWCVARII